MRITNIYSTTHLSTHTILLCNEANNSCDSIIEITFNSVSNGLVTGEKSLFDTLTPETTTSVYYGTVTTTTAILHTSFVSAPCQHLTKLVHWVGVFVAKWPLKSGRSPCGDKVRKGSQWNQFGPLKTLDYFNYRDTWWGKQTPITSPQSKGTPVM